MSKHFAVVAPPAPGHVNPSLPLVEELVRRGHRVTYATGENLLPTVEAAGATGLALPTRMPSPPPAAAEMTPQHLAEMMGMLLADARESFPTLVSWFQQDRPDAVCSDMLALTGRVLAELLGVTNVALLPSFAANERFSPQEMFMPASFDLRHPALLEIGTEFEGFAADYGVTEPPSPFAATPAPLNLVFIPEQFQIAAETFDERFRFLGPSLGHREYAEQWQPREDESPLLFISLGTAFNNRPDFYRMCLEAFADSAWQVAMAVGEHVDPDELGVVPDNFEVRTRFAQPAVLARATAFLSHAGMNSTMESLYYGVPLVTFPQMPEQEANARRAEELGLGRMVPAEPTAEVLRKTVDEVAGDERIRANVAAMRETVRSGGGPVAGAEALEAHLA
ncbi:macrolide family glycosyltransferase [Haloactinomyces albus]|uniref:MGT family glycosyltransferase n=1 Tax=Haloactinomyces albus TaxID=1352928 RepID=A0AAE3ZA30_9ACTN|nr:macrolide family glycosyltransferase [Haloactinomyces albus]MDR7299903.1 MGT family glycosyltransferase [Haloactinomyces albus]